MCLYKYMRGEAPPKQNYLLKGGPLEHRLCPPGECSRDPSVSVHQLTLWWEAACSFSEFFLNTLSVWLPILWWVIYKCTCLHCAECSAVFEQKQHDPHSLSSLFTWSCPKWLFNLFPQVKNVHKGKCFADVEEVKQKTAETLKSIKIEKFKNCFKQWKKKSQ